MHRFTVLNFLWKFDATINFHEVTSGPWDSWAIFWIWANVSAMASHQCLLCIFEEFGLLSTLVGSEETHMSPQMLPFLLFSDATCNYPFGLQQ